MARALILLHTDLQSPTRMTFCARCDGGFGFCSVAFLSSRLFKIRMKALLTRDGEFCHRAWDV